MKISAIQGGKTTDFEITNGANRAIYFRADAKGQIFYGKVCVTRRGVMQLSFDVAPHRSVTDVFTEFTSNRPYFLPQIVVHDSRREPWVRFSAPFNERRCELSLENKKMDLGCFTVANATGIEFFHDSLAERRAEFCPGAAQGRKSFDVYQTGAIPDNIELNISEEPTIFNYCGKEILQIQIKDDGIGLVLDGMKIDWSVNLITYAVGSETSWFTLKQFLKKAGQLELECFVDSSPFIIEPFCWGSMLVIAPSRGHLELSSSHAAVI